MVPTVNLFCFIEIGTSMFGDIYMVYINDYFDIVFKDLFCLFVENIHS